MKTFTLIKSFIIFQLHQHCGEVTRSNSWLLCFTTFYPSWGHGDNRWMVPWRFRISPHKVVSNPIHGVKESPVAEVHLCLLHHKDSFESSRADLSKIIKCNQFFYNIHVIAFLVYLYNSKGIIKSHVLSMLHLFDNLYI